MAGSPISGSGVAKTGTREEGKDGPPLAQSDISISPLQSQDKVLLEQPHTRQECALGTTPSCGTVLVFLRSCFSLPKRVVVTRQLDQPLLLDRRAVPHEPLRRLDDLQAEGGREECQREEEKRLWVILAKNVAKQIAGSGTHLVIDDVGRGGVPGEVNRRGVDVKNLCASRRRSTRSAERKGSASRERREGTHGPFSHTPIAPIRLGNRRVAEVPTRQASPNLGVVLAARDDGDVEAFEVLAKLSADGEGSGEGFEVETMLRMGGKVSEEWARKRRERRTV